MTESKIRCFLAVAQTGSFTKAAEVLYISQPSISKQVSQLEEELGHMLLDRTQKVISLTDVGKMYYDFFIECSARLKKITELAPKTNLSHRGVIRVGFPRNWEEKNFAPYFSLFSQQYPNVSFTFHKYASASLPHMIRNAEADLVLCPSYLLHRYGCITKQITNINAVLLYPKTSESFHPNDLRSYTVITDIPYGSPQDIIERVCFYFKASSLNFRQTADILSELEHTDSAHNAFLSDAWSTHLAGSSHNFLTLNLKIPVVLGCINDDAKGLKNFVLNEFLFQP